MTENEILHNDDETIDDNYFDKQDLRVIRVLAPGKAKDLDEIPIVSSDTIKIYYQHLKEILANNILLTGRESLGYFEWEEQFEWDDGNESAYEKLRDKYGSFKDKYQLLALLSDNREEKIIAEVLRQDDQKTFHIPLEDLEACDQAGEAWLCLEDYAFWFENFND